jgi:large subunit ribosomal protein L22
MNVDLLYVSGAYANPGPILKRFMPRAHGRAYRINKRTTHISIAVSEKA